jgi:hypothetical protein
MIHHYHGTAAEFDRFDPKRLGTHHRGHAGGFWFSSDLSIARAFALSVFTDTLPKSTWGNVPFPPIADIPRWRDRFEAAREYVRRERLYSMVSGAIGLPMVPGEHWAGAWVLRCEIDGPIHVCQDERVVSPGIVGGGLFGRDPEAFSRAVAKARAAGAVAVHLPNALEGVAGQVTFSPTTFLLDPDAVRIVERLPAMATIEPWELADAAALADEELSFWASEYLPETSTHVALEDGQPWFLDKSGDRWTRCGSEWSAETAIADEGQEPTCELCAIEWRHRDDPEARARALEEYFA